jgi:outer membrane lipoprotein-sorting protein
VFAVIRSWISKFALAAALGLAGLGVTGIAPAAAQPQFTADQLSDLERVNQYLNGLGFLQGRFIQVSDTGGGFSEGTFYMAERTRLRFEYDPPIPLTFISDGTFVGIANDELETTSQYPIGATPLRVLLRRNVDLTEDANITDVERLPGQLRVVATEDGGIAQGELTMVFSDPGMELRQWIIVDAQGRRTTIALRDVQEVDSLDDDLFRFPQYDNSDIFE